MPRKLVVVLLSVLACGLGIAVFGVARLQHTLRETAEDVARADWIDVDLLPLSPPASLPVFEPIGAPADDTAGAAFAGRLWLGGPGGLTVYAAPGVPPQRLRTGIELPAAPVVAVATGEIGGEITLIAATRGAGLLLFDRNGRGTQLLPRTPAARDVTAVLPLGSGDLLLGTHSLGVLVYRGGKARTTGTAANPGLRAFAPGLSGLDVTALAGDDGDLWVGTRDRGVLHWHAGQLDHFGPDTGLPDPDVQALAVGPEDAFVGTPRGIAHFREGHPAGVLGPDLFVRSLALDGDRLLVGTIDQGLRTISLSPGPARLAAHSGGGQPDAAVTGFFRDRTAAGGTLFAVATGSLLASVDAGAWRSVLPLPAAPLADRNVAALHLAPDGRLWIGYFNHGLDVLDTGAGTADHLEDDHVFCVNRIVDDPLRHTIDVATANGLALFDPAAGPLRERAVLLKRDGLLADHVSDVAFSGDTTVLATPAGLTFLSPGGSEGLYAFEGLVNNHVYALAADARSGRILAGTLGGLSLVDGKEVRRNLTVNNSGLKHNWITALLPSPAQGNDGSAPGGYLVGTYGTGVMEMDAAGHVSAVEGATLPAIVNPNAMLRTATHIFVGTLDRGLLVEDLSTGRWSQVTAGLPSRNVTALAAAYGVLYVGTDNGLLRAEEARLP